MDVAKILPIALLAATGLASCSQAAGGDPASTAGVSAAAASAAVAETVTVEPAPVDTSACQEAVDILHEALVKRHEDFLILMVEAPTASLEELPDVIDRAETLDQVNGRIEDANAALADCPGSQPLDLIEASDVAVPTPAPEPSTEPAVPVTKEDFSVTLFVTENKCFNSAGSSVEFEPELAVEDPENFPAVSGTLVYEVRAGDEDMGRFSIEFLDDGTYNYGGEFISPEACYDDNEITAQVIRVRSR